MIADTFLPNNVKGLAFLSDISSPNPHDSTRHNSLRTQQDSHLENEVGTGPTVCTELLSALFGDLIECCIHDDPAEISWREK